MSPNCRMLRNERRSARRQISMFTSLITNDCNRLGRDVVSYTVQACSWLTTGRPLRLWLSPPQFCDRIAPLPCHLIRWSGFQQIVEAFQREHTVISSRPDFLGEGCQIEGALTWKRPVVAAPIQKSQIQPWRVRDLNEEDSVGGYLGNLFQRMPVCKDMEAI